MTEMTTTNFFEEKEDKTLLAVDNTRYEAMVVDISTIDTSMDKSTDTNMTYPIVVVTKAIQRSLTGLILKNDYKVIFGGGILKAALNEGYTHIEVHVLDTVQSYNHDRRKLKRLFRR